MRIALVLVLFAGCAESPAAAATLQVTADEGAKVHDAAAYEAALAKIEGRRLALARRFKAAEDAGGRAAVRAEARTFTRTAMREVVLPAWLGMPWGLGPDSTPTRPHQAGTVIACGYFVSSTLENLGLKLDTRFRFAQAPALHAQRSLAPAPRDLHVFFSIPGDLLARKIAALGEGLYVIGLNNHIGFVDVRGEEVRLIHASYTGEQLVTDEPLAAAQVIANSRAAGYFVTPLLQDDRLVEHWLRGEAVPLQTLGPRA